ncbi:MAG: hypothetical protein A2Y17_09810 [Clostridiales bacterium GWF2_38_85]|nr:MAG: hypothetical protein A2Y17_09810 [Clostridiales bacterium GWF2_38_85]
MADRVEVAYRWWCAILKVGIFLFFAAEVYSCLYRWIDSPHFSVTQRLLGLAIDGVSLVLLFASQLSVIKLSRVVRSERIFSHDAMRQARGVFIYFLAWTLYVPVQRTLEGLVFTLHNPVGHRILAVVIGTPDFIRVVILAILAFFMFVLQRGIDLSEEQSLTI